MPDEVLGTGGLDSTEIVDGESPAGGLRTRLGRFYYHGEPIYLVQTATYGIRTDRGYDGRDPAFWRGLIDRLAALQTGGVHFRIRIDPWAFCYDTEALSPWARSGDRWDLTRFDESFWSVLRGVADYAFSHDVLVEFVLFNTGTLRMGRGGTGWACNPFNEALGGMLTRDPAAVFYHLPLLDAYDLAMAANSAEPEVRMQREQERFVREAVRRLDGLDNVSWEIASQMEGVDPIRSSFLDHYVELLHQIDPLDRVATASVRTLRRADQALYRQVGIDTVQFWLPPGLEPHEELVETVSALRAYSKPVVAGEADIEPNYSTIARSTVWQTYVAGGHACAGALLADPRDPAMESFVSFVAHTGPAALTPDPKLVVSRTSGLHCHGGRADAGAFVVYATTDSPATEVEAVLRLTAGRWKATSVSPSSGEVLAERVVEAIRPATTLPLPPFEEDLAVRLVKVL